MLSLAFLGVAVAISLIGLVIVALRSRRSQPWDAGITEFQYRLDAIKPDPNDEIQWAMRQVEDDGRTSAGS